MGLLDIFGIGKKKEKMQKFLADGAVTIDVRSAMEFKGGHPKGAINIPLDTISKNIKKIQKYNKPIITCCASGMRSGVAASQLKQAGLEVVNGGPWYKVQRLIEQK